MNESCASFKVEGSVLLVGAVLIGARSKIVARMSAPFLGRDIRDRRPRMSPSRVKNAIWLIRRSPPSGEGGCGLRGLRA